MSYDVPSPVDDDDDVEPYEVGARWSWVFWLLVVTAASPLVLAAASVQHLWGDDSVMAQFLADSSAPPAVFADRWDVVVMLSTVGSAGPLAAVAVLTLAGIVASGRPGWLVVPQARWVVGALAVACVVWTAVTVTLTAWSTLGAPTPREVAAAQDGSVPATWVEWAPNAAPDLFALVVALVAVVLCVITREPRGSRPVDPGDPTPWADERPRR